MEELLDDFLTKQLEEINSLQKQPAHDKKHYEELSRSDYEMRFHIIKQGYPGRFDTDISDLTDKEVRNRYQEIILDIRAKIEGHNYTYDDIKRLSDMIIDSDLNDFHEKLIEILPEKYEEIINMLPRDGSGTINIDEIEAEKLKLFNSLCDIIIKGFVMAIHDERITSEKSNAIKKALSGMSMISAFQKLDCIIL